MGHILGKYKYHIETEYCRNIRLYFVKESIIHDRDIPKKMDITLSVTSLHGSQINIH